MSFVGKVRRGSSFCALSFPLPTSLSTMDPSVDAYSLQLLVSLTAGFAALLEQMEDLKCKNTNLEQRLLHIQEVLIPPFIRNLCAAS